MRNITVPLVPHDEQLKIAQFLDQETTRIDKLIAEKQNFIQLLKEKRQALISHVVTKGLNPDVKLKDSGVEWIGAVPEHWQKTKVKHSVREQVQMGPFGASLKELSDKATEHKLYGQENYISGDFAKGSRWLNRETYDQLQKYQLRPKDIVFTRKGSIGNCRQAPDNIQNGIIDSDSIRVRLDNTLLLNDFFVILAHESWYISTQLDYGKRGAILSGLNTGNIKDLVVFLPPIHEQIHIISYLNNFKEKLHNLTNETQTSINLLKEHRTALISAAVTGKIDVRDYKTQAA